MSLGNNNNAARAAFSHDLSNSSGSNTGSVMTLSGDDYGCNGSMMTLSGGDNNCSGSVMTLNEGADNCSGSVMTLNEGTGDVNGSVVTLNEGTNDVCSSCISVNGGNDNESFMSSSGEVASSSADDCSNKEKEGLQENEKNTSRESLDSFPPPPDFLLQDESISKSNYQQHLETDEDKEISRNNSDVTEMSKEVNTNRAVLFKSNSHVMGRGSCLSQEEFSSKVAKQLYQTYSGANNQLSLCVNSQGGNNSSSQTSQNSSPSSLDQLSPLLDDDHPSPPSPCPPSPSHGTQSAMLPSTMPLSPHLEEPTPLPNTTSEENYSTMFGPPRPIQDEAIAQRKVSVSEAVRNLQKQTGKKSIENTEVAVRNASEVSSKLTEPEKKKPLNCDNAVLDQSADIGETRNVLISKLNAKITEHQKHNSTSSVRISNSQYDPYTQPLPMKLHQDEVLQQCKERDKLSDPPLISSPNQNSNTLYSSSQLQHHQKYIPPQNSSPNANTSQQHLTIQQQQQLEHLQQQQQHIIQQQQQLKQQQQQTSHHSITAKPETKAFIATLNTTLSHRPSPPHKTTQRTANSSAVSHRSFTTSSQPRTQLTTQPSPRSGTSTQKSTTRSSLTGPPRQKKRIVMGTSSKTSSLSSSIPQPNNSSNTPTSSSSSSRLARSSSTANEKFRFRQLISKTSSSPQSRESAAAALANSRSRPASVACPAALTSAGKSEAVQLREGLLEQIRRGAKLRQTKHVADRSAPRVH